MLFYFKRKDFSLPATDLQVAALSMQVLITRASLLHARRVRTD